MREMSRPNQDFFLRDIVELLHDVNGLLRDFYVKEIMIHEKKDGSPVTDADHKSHEMIMNVIERLTPGIKVISEEGDDFTTHGQKQFWLVDPLDGTKGFINKTGHFCANLALVEDGIPTLGFIAMPLEDKVISGSNETGVIIWENGENGKEPKKIRRSKDINPQSLNLIVGGSSRRLRQRYAEILNPLKYGRLAIMGSALKFCHMAQGESDVYIRLRPTYEWDTAAGHAILKAMGGDILKLDKTPLIYGKKDLLNPGFIAVSDVELFK